MDEGLTALVLLGYVRRGGVPDPYQFRVDLPQGAQLTLLQYEFLMNLLALAHPAGVGVETYTLRQRHVALGGTVAPLPPNISRTYRPFRRTRSRGEVATTLPPAPATTTGPRWTSLGGWVNGLSLASNKDGRLEIFTRGAQRDLSHLAETSNGWGPWGSLGRPSASVQVTGEPAAGVNARYFGASVS